MEFSHAPNHYELLDVSPEASPQEIRAAYVRAKATFQKDSVALYSLLDPAEAQEMVQKIENAYQVLSHPERKREYDRDFLSNAGPRHSLFSEPGARGAPAAFGTTRDKVVSIDRVPPMEGFGGDELLVAPATDFSVGLRPTAPAESTAVRTEPSAVEPPRGPELRQAEPAPAGQTESPSSPPPTEPDLEQVEEWTGERIRLVREARGFAMERMVETTRIRRSYLAAIEADDFAKLPAPVFVRGFLQQIARELRIPAERLMRSYLERLQKWTQSSSSR